MERGHEIEIEVKLLPNSRRARIDAIPVVLAGLRKVRVLLDRLRSFPLDSESVLIDWSIHLLFDSSMRVYILHEEVSALIFANESFIVCDFIRACHANIYRVFAGKLV